MKRSTSILAAVAALVSLPALADTVVQKQVTTQTVVDCTTILGDADRLACYQRQTPALTTTTTTAAPIVGTTTVVGAPVVTKEQQTVREADGSLRSVETTRTVAPTAVVPVIPAVPETRITTTTEAPATYSKTTTTTRTVQ